jgi:acyl CoA:acetate/3-ketoacid CoA transferase beta subunit
LSPTTPCIGPFPTQAELDTDMINAGKQTVTARAGASYIVSHKILLNVPCR